MEHLNNILYTDIATQEIISLGTLPTEQVYYCIKNIGNSINVENTLYWRKIPNYFLSSNSLGPKFQLWINRLQVQTYPLWNDTLTYYKNNIVTTDDGKTAICITTNEKGTTAALTDVNNWLILDLQGREGSLSLGVNYTGTWISGNNYQAGDMVIYSSSSGDALYVARKNLTPSINVPIEGDEWMFLTRSTEFIGIDIVDSIPTNLQTVSNVFIVNLGDRSIWYTSNEDNTQAIVMYPEVVLSKIYINRSALMLGWWYLKGTKYDYFNGVFEILFNKKNLSPNYRWS